MITTKDERGLLKIVDKVSELLGASLKGSWG
jgi:hypothetical protein